VNSPLYWFIAHSEEKFPVSRQLGGVIGRWIYETWIYEIVLSVVLGWLIGYVARKSLRFAEMRNWLDGTYSNPLGSHLVD
jgi:NhaP-type Na+/H+ or K+/H+ antiporter